MDTSIVDPFPPEETWKSYDRPEARQRRFGGNVFSLLLQSLNPNFDVNRVRERVLNHAPSTGLNDFRRMKVTKKTALKGERV